MKKHLFWDKARKWDRKLISDLKVLVIGHGHIGSTIANCLSPLCKNLEVVDPNSNIESISPKVSFNYNDLTFCDVDLLIVASNLNSSTENLINKTALDKMSDDVVIINTARGQSLVTRDLLKAIEEKLVLGACLDVFDFEKFNFETIGDNKFPDDFIALKENDKVLLSPHIAGWTEESYVKLSSYLAQKIIKTFKL